MFALDVSETVSLSSVVLAAVVSVLGVVGFQNRRARTAAIRTAFEDVVASLASPDKERQLAGAVLLRRFFDEKSELGMRDVVFRRRAPYATEARSVLAAVLRGLPSGDLQKLLADGLAYAPPMLAKADLQRTNLQEAYLAPQRTKATLVDADFYRADLSGASLKNASATGAAFYQARARGTIFRGADLSGANFFEADLAGARFEGAQLLGASFLRAVNVPVELVPHIGDDGIYNSAQPAPPAGSTSRPAPRRVFVSLPSTRSARQESQWRRVRALLEEHDLDVQQLAPRDYPRSGALSEISRRMSTCTGAVIFGLSDDTPADAEHPTLGVTPWTHVEAGMAHGLGLPLLVIREQDVTAGAFADDVAGHHATTITLPRTWEDSTVEHAIVSWARDFPD